MITLARQIQLKLKKFDEAMINLLEDRQPPFYSNLQNTVRYAAIKND